MARRNSRLPNLEAKHKAIETLMRELPDYWLRAEDIAQCVGGTLQGVSKILTHQAADGVLECRMTTWRSGRSRPRQRREFRFVPASAAWHRYPAWLEPPLHPINQTACRRIHGRAALKEHQPMNEQQYRDLPRNVREKFSALRDEQFADHPDVVAARHRLEAAETAHRSAAETAHRLRTRKAQIEALAQSLAQQRRELHRSRIQHVADALVTAGAFDVTVDADRQLAEQIEQADIVLAAAPHAQADLDEQLVAVHRRIQLAAGDAQSAAEDLRGALDALKLAAAQA